EYDEQKAEKYDIMKQRYDAVNEALKDEKYQECFEALPFNSGYFMCVKLAEGLVGEEVRQVLISNYSIGLISLGNVLRIAFSAVAAADVKEMFDGIYKACLDCKK
ncbi:MAG: hypothetical protein R3182_04865, partial [Draconibacterium sp.]|nr:hypothetical protein [Draconibacterium sp.]